MFTKYVSSFSGPDSLVAPRRSNTDWEVELVVVINVLSSSLTLGRNKSLKPQPGDMWPV